MVCNAIIVHTIGQKTSSLIMAIAGLPLHQNLEMALDRAQIAIVPIPPEQKGDNRWKIILVDESMREKLALGSASPPLYWRVSSWNIQVDVL